MCKDVVLREQPAIDLLKIKICGGEWLFKGNFTAGV
jgi:hypothetical protein